MAGVPDTLDKIPKMPGSRRTALWVLAGAWLLVAIVGVTVVARADATPGESSGVARWPSSSHLSRSKNHATLLVFVHPQCPCSVATIAELERLVAHASGRLDVEVVVFLPADDPVGWRETALVERAQAIPGVHVVFDLGGREGALFAATTSGQVLLFEPGGETVFRGGITAARGHEGDNEGRSAIESIAAGRTPLLRDTHVFGCELLP
jgi:hypothetical protein